MSQFIIHVGAILCNVAKKVFKFYSQMLSKSYHCPEGVTEIVPHC